MAEKTDGVSVRMGKSLRCDLAVRDQRLVADLPADQGGTNEGPAPGELLLLAHGACTAMTLRIYAERKKWSLDSVDVELSQAWVTREEWPDRPAGEERERIPRIVRKVRIRGDLSEEQLERLRDVAKRCPVHRTLTEHPHVVDEVVHEA